MTQRLVLVQESGFDRVADRRVGNGLQLQAASLAYGHDHGIADVIGTDPAPLDFHNRQGRRRATPLVAHGAVGRLEPVQNRLPWLAAGRQRVGQLTDRLARSPVAVGLASHPVGDHQHSAVGA